MSKTVQVNEVASQITKWLTEYTDEVTDACKEVVDKVSEEVMQEIKDHVTFNDKSYSKSFRIKTSFYDKRNKRNTWYVASPHYRLTHLLEFGHIIAHPKDKTRTRAYPHVRYGDEWVQNNFEREITEAIEKCRVKN